MILPNSESGFKSQVLLSFISVLFLSEADIFRTHEVRDVHSNAEKCFRGLNLELKINGILVPEFNTSHAVADEDDVEIVCMSPTPVYLRYIGYPLLKTSEWKASSFSKRIFDSCFTSTIQFKANKNFIGEYECQQFNRERLKAPKSSVYIYVTGIQPYLLLNSKGIDVVKINAKNRSNVILPCAVSNPSISVDLEKNGENTTDLYPFDPKFGFHISNISESDLFKCTARGSDRDLKLSVIKSQDITEYSKSYPNISLNMNRSSEGKPVFECRGATSMTVIMCNTRTECDFFRKCLELDGVDCKQSTETGKPCDEKEDCVTVTLQNSRNSSGGIIFCSNHDSEVPTEFKFFVNRNGVPMFEEDATAADTMSFGLSSYGEFLNYDFVIYGEPPITLECNASKNIHSQGLQWGFLYNSGGINHTYPIHPQGSDSEEALTNVYSRKSDISFYLPKSIPFQEETILFICRAPRIDSIEFDVIYHELKLKFDSEHIFLDSPLDETVCLDYNSDETVQNISCKAKGNAVFSWTENDGTLFAEDSGTSSITEHIYFDGKLYTKSTVNVQFTRQSETTVYRCTASNAANPNGVSRNITVKLKCNSPIWTSNATVLGSCLFVLTACFVIGGYVLHKRAKPFPEELIEKFYNGYFESFDKNCVNEESDDDAQENPDENIEKNYGDTNFPVQGIVFAPHDKQSEINPRDVAKSSPYPFGSGQFGLVYLAEYRQRLNMSEIKLTAGSGSPNMELSFLPSQPVYAPEKTVVWKEPNAECKGDNCLFFEFLKEIKFMEHVGRHENIVEFIGCMASRSLVQNRKAVIIMEYCKLGDLEEYLINHRSSFQNEFTTPKVKTQRFDARHDVDITQISRKAAEENQISTSNLIQWAYEIACGLEFLASKKFIHRDIAARNVLLTENMVAKITDFGLARFVQGDKTYYRPIVEPSGVEDVAGNKRTLKFPIPWLPIESLRTLKFSEDSDIWAFGVTLWEIFSLGEEPYKDTNLRYISYLLADYLAKGNRLSKPDAANVAIYDIMLRCWAAEGKNRPRFTELKELINVTKSHLNPSGSTTPTAADNIIESEPCDDSENSDAYSTYSNGSSHNSLRPDLCENAWVGYDSIMAMV